jgi:Glycosyltransferase 61
MDTIKVDGFSSLSSYSLDVEDDFSNRLPLYRPAAYIGNSLREVAEAQAKKGKGSRDFGPELSMRSAFVGRFRRARVGGRYTILQTSEGQFVETTVPPTHREDILKQFNDARVVVADAPAGILLGGWLACNYFHWMCQALPTLEYIKRTAHPECRIVIGRPSSWTLQSLEMAGFGPERIDIIDDDVVRTYENLYFPFSDIGHYHWLRPGLESFYGAMRPSDPHPDEMECVYVSRRGALRRPMRNEDALEGELAARGFSIVRLEDLRLSQQIDWFRRAKLVVAPHGAGLTNLIFCKKGTPVYELVPQHNVRSTFFHVAQYHDLQYHADCFKALPGGGWSGGWDVKVPLVLERIDRLMAQV